jgi:hypothetical protein
MANPLFSVNDGDKMNSALLDDCCPVCGDKLLRGRWFVGGPRSAFDPAGCYFDAPMHGECKDYSMQVCPWLAAPKYLKIVGPKKAEAANLQAIDHTSIPGRPDPFVAVLARGQTILHPETVTSPFLVRPLRPYIRVEYWRHGKLLDPGEGFREAMQKVSAAEEV